MAYSPLSDKANGAIAYTPLSNASSHPQATDSSGAPIPATPAYTPLTFKAAQAQSLPENQQDFIPGKAPFSPSYAPVGDQPAPAPAEPSTFAKVGSAALDLTKEAADKVYTVGSGLLLPGSTPEERHDLHFLYTVAQALPGAVVDTGKQIVTHPFRSSEDLVGGLARGIADTTTNTIIDTLVPADQQEATRAQVQETLNKYLSPPDSEGSGGNIAAGGEVGGSAAPAITAGVAGGGLAGGIASRFGLGGFAAKAAALLGEGAGFVGAGQASVPANAPAGTRLDQALTDIIGLGIFKVGGVAAEKAKTILSNVKAKAPQVLERAETAYNGLPEDMKAKGVIPNPSTYKPLIDQETPSKAPSEPVAETPAPAAPEQPAAEQPAPQTAPEIPKPQEETAAPVTESAPEKPVVEPASPGIPETVPKEIYRGSGRASKESAYTGAAVPIAGDAKYFAYTEDAAKEYGPNVEKVRTADVVTKPLVVRDFSQWRDLTREAGWKFPNPVGLPAEDIQKLTTALQKVVTNKGHDGIVVDWDPKDPHDIGPGGEDIKGLRRVFGEPQVISFNKEAAKAPRIESPEDQKALQDRTAEIQGELSDSPEAKQDWSDHYEERHADLTSKLDTLEKQISEMPKKDRVKVAAAKTQAAELGGKIARMESDFMDKWQGKAEKMARAEREPKQEREPAPKKTTRKKGNGVADFEGFTPKELEEPTAAGVTEKLDDLSKQSDIIKYLSDKLDVPIRRGKFRQAALGIFKNKPQVVRLKSGGLDTVFHEIFHHLNERFKFADQLKGLDDEREALLEQYGKPPEDLAKRRSEAFSEFGRYLLTGQVEKLQTIAPDFLQRFGELMQAHPDIKEVLDSAAANYKRWLDQSAAARVLSHISIGAEEKGPLKGRIASTAHDLYTQALDDLHPLSEYSKIAREANPGLKASADPYILARNLRGWIGRADTFLRKGTFGVKYFKQEGGKVVPDYTGKSFSEIVKPFEAAGKMDDLRAYLVARRAAELKGREIVTGITGGDAAAAVKELEEKNPDLKEAAADLYKYQDATLTYAMDSGLIDKEAFAQMRELNKDYVPFFRVYEEAENRGFMGGGGKKLGTNRNPVKAIKGSEREIIDPLESIVKNTYSLINAADRNAVAVAMARLSSTDYRLGRLVENVPGAMKMTKVNAEEVLKSALGASYDYIMADSPELASVADTVVNIFRPAFSTKIGEISVMMDGKYKVFEVEPDLYRAIQGLDKEDVATIVKILSYPASWLRAGATLTPDFAIRNPIRDQFSAFVYSKAGFLPGVDLMRGLYELYSQGDTYQLWKMGGGESASLVSIDRGGLQQSLEEVLRSKGATALHYAKNPMDILREFSNTFEVATRLGEMRKVLAATNDPTAAAYASREITLDFNRIGAKTKAVNLLVAFWNANVQGLDKMLRAVQENPGKTMGKVFLGITLPSVLLYYANRKDPRWKEIPSWQKDLFWIVMTPDHIIRIPKPFELGVLFGSVPERALEYMDNHDPKIFEELENSIASGASPGFIPTGLLPIIENISNYSFFLDRPIVPEGKQGLPPQFQAGQYTSEVSKVIGETLGYSPAKIDNLIQGYSGGLGTYATQFVDSFLVNTGIRPKPVQPATQLEDVAGIKAFLIRNPIGSGSESVNQLYSSYEQAQAGLQYVKDRVQHEDMAAAKAYIADHPEVAQAPQLSAVVSIFSALNKTRDQILDSKILSADEKRSRLDHIDQTMTDLAEKTLNLINKPPPSAPGG